MTIGEKIKICRKRLGYSQTELGEKLGVMKNAVSKWETGRVTAIPTQKLFTMAELFQIPLSELIDDGDVILRQNPDSKRAAVLALLKELNLYVSPDYDPADVALRDLTGECASSQLTWRAYNPMLGEEYRLSESRVDESVSLLTTEATVLFGPEECESYRQVLAGLHRASDDAQKMLAIQINILTK